MTLKRRNGPKAVRRRGSASVGQETEIARLTHELNEALERQAATTEVLRTISSSSGNLKTVFESMLASAMRICNAQFGAICLYDSNCYQFQAMRGAPPTLVEAWSKGPLQFGADTGLGRLASTKQTVHIADITAEKAYAERDPMRIATADILGARTWLGVPMLKHDGLVGAIVIYRKEVRPFTNQQIELIETFADQALIAIENARLFEAEQQHTRELAELLEQQTATSEVLRVISSSPSNLNPVFDTMLTNATRLCEANFGLLVLYEGGERFRGVAMHNAPPAFAELRWREPVFEATPQTALGRAAATKEVINAPDHPCSPGPNNHGP